MQSESDYEVRRSELSRFEMRYPQLDNGFQYITKNLQHSTKLSSVKTTTEHLTKRYSRRGQILLQQDKVL